MKKLISFLIGVLIIALVITCIVAFATCDGCDVPKTNVETEDKGDNNQQEDISFSIRYNGEDVKKGATLTFKEYNLNAIDIYCNVATDLTVEMNNGAPFDYKVNGNKVSSGDLEVDLTKYFVKKRTPTGFNFGVNHHNFLEYVLSKIHAVDGKDADILIESEVSNSYIYTLEINVDDTDMLLAKIFFNLESVSLELPAQVII